jgi:excisionase family DNA binding protein
MSMALLTTNEAARILGKSVSTVLRMADSGELPHARKMPGLRGGYLFDKAVVELVAKQLLARSAS